MKKTLKTIMKNIKNYLLLFLLFITYSNAYAVCNGQLEDINFGSIVLRDTPETTINSNIHFICDPGDIGKTMSVSFSKTTIENGGNSLDFDIFINGNQVIANQTYDFVLNDQDIIMVPVVFKLTNTTNSISSRSGVYTSSILLTYSY